MAPRDYDMRERERAVLETRRRILDATLALHTEKGIFGTSWQDIAERADVSVGTVYRHFPSLAELVPACGELLFERTAPPSPEDASATMSDLTDPVERLERAGMTLFSFYERAGAHIDSDARERELPEVREWEEYLRDTVKAFIREALRGQRAHASTLELVSAFFDFRTYGALRTRGITPERAAREVAAMVAAWLGIEHRASEGSRPRRRGRSS